MRVISFLTMAILLSGCGFIEIMPRHYSDDLYSKNANLVDEFSVTQIFKSEPAPTPESIKLESINYNQFSIITQKREHIWLILWAPWCPHCSIDIVKYISAINPDSIKLVLIATNYDVISIRKELYGIGYKGQAYILNAKDYSSNESEKIIKFRNEILSNSPGFSKMPDPQAVPQNYFFSSGNITMYKLGVVNTDSLKYYFK